MKLIDALGWALLHFLWQGTAIAAVLAALLLVLRRRPATWRYACSVTALGLMLAAPVATTLVGVRFASPNAFAARAFEPTAAPIPEATTPASDAPEAAATSLPNAAPASRPEAASLARLASWLPLGVRIWFCGVVVLALRLLWGWVGMRRLERHGTRAAHAATESLLATWTARLGIRARVRILETTALDVPAVLGWLRPVILMPAATLAGLTSRQLEMVLVHELAHIRRHDALVNVLQAGVETLLFYHPAVWWVSRRVREERENCCDDIVVERCGDATLYAETLLGLERLRGLEARLLPAASGAPLVQRVRRLVAPASSRHATFSHWQAGLIAALALVGIAAASLSGAPGGAAPAASFDSELLQAPDPSQPLSERWKWAHEQARQHRWQRYWIGHSIRPPQNLGGAIYAVRLDGDDHFVGDGFSLQGRLIHIGETNGFTAPGARLPAALGAPDDVALVFEFAAGKLQHVHVASLVFPLQLHGEPLIWLGMANDAESVPVVQRLERDAKDSDVRADLVTAIGVHATSALVVPLLSETLASRAHTDVRRTATEWLGRHSDPRALALLTETARNDRDPNVRREAAESVGEMQLPGATDSAIALARTLDDPDAQREAIETLGAKSDAASLAALLEIARDPSGGDASREAVETLGERPDKRGLEPLVDIANEHPNSDVRREAVETLGQNMPPDKAAALLADMARRNTSADARREAVETLAQLPGGIGADAVEKMARDADADDVDVRREAIESLAEGRSPEAAAKILSDIARREDSGEASREAIETLAHLPGGAGIPALIDLARNHSDPEMRRQAMHVLVDSDDPQARQAVEHAFER